MMRGDSEAGFGACAPGREKGRMAPRLCRTGAERSVLGALLGGAPVELLQTLGEGDFTEAAHIEVFRAMRRVAAAGLPIDLVTLDADLDQQGLLARVGGAGFLVELSQSVATTANVGAYVTIVQEASARRAAMAALRAGARRLGDAEAGLAETLAALRAALGSITLGDGEAVTMAQLVEHYIRTLADGIEPGIPLGLPGIDSHVSMLPGELIVVAARVGVGKTLVMQQAGIHAAGIGKSVLWVSAEMARGQIEERAVAHVSGVPCGEVKRRDIGPEALGRIGDALQVVRAWRMEYIFDARSISQVEQAVRRRARAGHFDLIIVDYLQFIAEGAGRGRTREQEVADVARRLKGLAMECGAPVLTAAQLGRGVDNTQGRPRRPRLSDLRESGSIESDADTVLFLFEVEEATALGERQKALLREVRAGGRTLVDVSIAKNRQGEKGVTYSFAFNGGMMRYEEVRRKS